jgi:hypothetical protein
LRFRVCGQDRLIEPDVKPYAVSGLLEKVVDQDKLLNAGGTKKEAAALLAGHGISRPTFKHENNKKGKQKKRCATKDCKILLGGTSTNSVTTAILRARRNPLPKMSLLP